MVKALNISYRRVGGIRFLKLGRITLSWSVASPDGASKRRSRREITQEVRTRSFLQGYHRGRRVQSYIARMYQSYEVT